MDKKIKQILVKDIGWVYAERQVDSSNGTYRIESHPIEEFTVNGEMASIIWYRQDNREYNGKYVVCVEYYLNPKVKELKEIDE